MRSSGDIEQAMHAYSDAVWRACLVYLSPSEVEDIFQDTFMKYALHDIDFRDESHKKAWLLRVAINACKDVLKAKRNKNKSLDQRLEQGEKVSLVNGLQEGFIDDCPAEEEARESSGGILDNAATSQSEISLSEILDVLNSLGDPPKTELYLSLYEGYTAQEIARMTGEPEGTVYSWISRGKKQLQKKLQEALR